MNGNNLNCAIYSKFKPLRAGINPAPTANPYPTGRGGVYLRPAISMIKGGFSPENRSGLEEIKWRSKATSLFDVQRWTFDVRRSSYKIPVRRKYGLRMPTKQVSDYGAEPRTSEPGTSEPRTSEPRTSEPRTQNSEPLNPELFFVTLQAQATSPVVHHQHGFFF